MRKRLNQKIYLLYGVGHLGANVRWRAWCKETKIKDVIGKRKDCLVKYSTTIQKSLQYDYFCHILKREMDQYLNFNEMGPNTRKRWKHSIPYWNNHLTQLWKILKTKKHTFTRAKRK